MIINIVSHFKISFFNIINCEMPEVMTCQHGTMLPIFYCVKHELYALFKPS